MHHPHILIKTHRWSSKWKHSTADHIFLTHRDLRGVLASYQRVGWAFDIDKTYVQEHMAWKVRSQASCCHTVRCSDIGLQGGLNHGDGMDSCKAGIGA